MIGLAYPGGPALAKAASKGDPHAFEFPRPMLAAKNSAFSFSGLKTAVLYTLQDLVKTGQAKLDGEAYATDEKLRSDLCASFQQAVVDVLVRKTVQAAARSGARSVFVSGGVSANVLLRDSLRTALSRELTGVQYRCPPMAFTGDNAAMIAVAAYYRISSNRKRGESLFKLSDPRGLSIEADANARLC